MNSKTERQLVRFGHSCVLITLPGATGRVRLLLDPGNLTPPFSVPNAVDAVLVTHAHPDHIDTAQVQQLSGQTELRVFGPAGTAASLEGAAASAVTEVSSGSLDIQGVSIVAIAAPHEEIYSEVPVPENLAYFIDGKILAPGDSFFVPDFEVDVLLLPLGAPWMKLSETIDYLNELAPRVVIPVHDAGLAPAHQGLHQTLIRKFAPDRTTVIVPALGETVSLTS